MFASSVAAIPLLLDRPVSVREAVLASVRAALLNPVPMALWATLILVVGLGYKIFDFARTPAPLKIPTTPAPTTRTGVALRMAREVVLFESLFKSNLWTWACGWLFHAGLALVLVRHLRYFVEPVPAALALVPSVSGGAVDVALNVGLTSAGSLRVSSLMVGAPQGANGLKPQLTFTQRGTHVELTTFPGDTTMATRMTASRRV